MPTFFTDLLLYTAAANELAQLQEELTRQSFTPVTGGRRQIPGPASLHFKRQAKSIHEVSGAVLKAVKKQEENFRIPSLRKSKRQPV